MATDFSTKVYEKNVRELASSSKPLTELGAALKMEGGGFNKYLQNLVHADFITRYRDKELKVLFEVIKRVYREDFCVSEL